MNNVGSTILNLGSGKIKPLGIEENQPYFLVNLDNGYYGGAEPSVVQYLYYQWLEPDIISPKPNKVIFVKEDAFTFLEKYPLLFDKIVIYGFLEHIPKRDVLYFIYLLACNLKEGGEVDCIVPDYEALAHMILSEEVFSKDFEQRDIIISTELLNEVSSPHASIWTKDRIKKFFELEQRFKAGKIITSFNFDGRDIYIRAIIERV